MICDNCKRLEAEIKQLKAQLMFGVKEELRKAGNKVKYFEQRNKMTDEELLEYYKKSLKNAKIKYDFYKQKYGG